MQNRLKYQRMLKSAIDFHGHLGPYLVLGLMVGNLAINKLKCKRHFGVKAIVKGAIKKPKSCLIDGIQISAGCTYGKGNIQKTEGKEIQVLFYNLRNRKKMKICFNNYLLRRLDALKGRKDSEAFARELFNTDPRDLFKLGF